MIKELGGLLGWLIIILYGITLLNYVVKYINKKYSSVINNNEKLKKTYRLIMKIVIKYHKIFGFLAITLLLIHFIIQYNTIGLNIKGLIAAILMICQVGLGIYGEIKKISKGVWLYVHRTIAIILIIAIVLHVYF